MKIYVLRHGHSPSAGDAGVKTDSERPLSPKGREDVRRIAEALAGRGAAPAVILTSPLLRAMQTAEEAASVLRPKLGVRAFEPLANELPGEALGEVLLTLVRGEKLAEVLAVGHQPQVGELVASLTGSLIDFRPGGLAAVEAAEGGAISLLWTASP